MRMLKTDSRKRSAVGRMVFDFGAAIARRLAISVHTVKFHIASLLDKLDAQGRAEAVAQGARLGAIRL